MNAHHNADDQRLDELLHELGPHIPNDSPDEHTRARLHAMLEPNAPRVIPRRASRTPFLAASALAAALGIACALLWFTMNNTRNQLVTTQWENDEILQLLVSARRTQPIIAVPDDLTDLDPDSLLVLTFHHDLCPIAAITSPRFATMQDESKSGGPTFRSFDVTGTQRDSTQHDIDELGLNFALLGPLGAETGVVKVIDTSNNLILSAAPGNLGIEQAQTILARAAAASSSHP